jgi:hypothetical protein
MAHALSGELAPDRCTGPLAMTSARTTSAIDGIVRGARCIGKRRHCPQSGRPAGRRSEVARVNDGQAAAPTHRTLHCRAPGSTHRRGTTAVEGDEAAILLRARLTRCIASAGFCCGWMVLCTTRWCRLRWRRCRLKARCRFGVTRWIPATMQQHQGALTGEIALVLGYHGFDQQYGRIGTGCRTHASQNRNR